MDYFGKRYYDSFRGQWLEVDPMDSKYPGTSPYDYVLSNPINIIDPSGAYSYMIDGMPINDETGNMIMDEYGQDYLKWQNPVRTENNKINNGHNLGNKYKDQSKAFYYAKVAYGLSEGVGFKGTYFISGGYSIEKSIDGQWKVVIVASGKSSASDEFNIEFWGNAILKSNGKIISSSSFQPNSTPNIRTTGFSDIGSVSFSLPQYGNIQIELKFGSVVNGGPGIGETPITGILNGIINIPTNNNIQP